MGRLMINLNTPISDENADIFNFKEISEKVSENIRKFNQVDEYITNITSELNEDEKELIECWDAKNLASARIHTWPPDA